MDQQGVAPRSGPRHSSPPGHDDGERQSESEESHASTIIQEDGLAAENTDVVTSINTSINAPVFWTTRHGRSVSSASYHSLNSDRPAPISLEDHSGETHELSQSCWAQSATIDDFVIISGPTGIGAYIVWHCTVKTLKGGDIPLRKRYSEFDQLRANLVRSFPHAEAMIPPLPRKSIVSRFRPWFLEQRQAGLSHFLNCILLNPEFAASPILKDFIFS